VPNGKESNTEKLVEDVLVASRPKTVKELLTTARSKNPGTFEREILDAVKNLSEDGRLHLKPARFRTFGEFFLNPYWNLSLWIVLALSATSGLLYVSAPVFPWSLSEIPPGLLLVFYLPGHSFLRVLLGSRSTQPLERMVLEIATSIVLVMLLGLLLNFSGLGLFSAPALGSVIVLNVVLAIWATFHEYSTLRDGR